MAVTWHQAELIRTFTLTDSVRHFVFKLLHNTTELKWKAGQFITCDLPIGEKRNQRWRSYSIANLPNDENLIELCIAYKPNGLASKYFFNTLQLGDQIRFKSPEGNFVLPDNESKHLIFISTGTGIVPFRAMLLEIIKNQVEYSGIDIVFGTRYEKDILFGEEMQNYTKTISNCAYHLALSQETKTEININSSTYTHGYVHKVYLQLLSNVDIKNYLFYLCGWSNMIDDAVVHLMKDLKCERTQIKFELYG